MRLRFILLIILISVLAGCTEDKQLGESGSLAKVHLEDKGYDVISLIKEDSMILQEGLLIDPGYQQIWDVQPFEPESYVGEEINLAEFTVEKHPLEEIYDTETTLVTVFLHEGEVIGGWSFPSVKNKALTGSTHSLDGKAIEGVQE